MRVAAWIVAASACGIGLAASPASAAGDCAALSRLKIENVNLLSSVEVPAAGDLPAYCRVLGFVRPAVNFEVRLPVQGWNGKFYMAGCGGFCGTLDSDRPGFTNAMNFGLRRNYAVSTMDAGHWGTSVVDGRWAANNPVAQMDWGQRAVTETARTSKVLVAAFYGEPQRKSYFVGCSTGGRMAAMEASRFPKDFDGIVSGAPALDYTGLVGTLFAWVAKANAGPDGKPILSTAKAKLVGDAVASACAQPGLKDAPVADPRACRFQPSSLACNSADGAQCLTPAEVSVVEKWYKGPTDTRGRQLFAGGIPVGSEAHWPRWLTGLAPSPALMPLFGQDFVRYMAIDPAPGPTFGITDYDFDRDPPRMVAASRVYNAATYDPDRPEEVAGADLSAFQAAGGKMILYHGWADPLVTPFLTVSYYETLARKSGGLDKAQSFARLFMVPGMDHCGIGTAGPGIADTGIDPLTALERWVEAGQAPDQLLATKTGPSGETVWQRPVCAFPKAAEYRGTGNPAEAASFACTGP